MSDPVRLSEFLGGRKAEPNGRFLTLARQRQLALLLVVAAALLLVGWPERPREEHFPIASIQRTAVVAEFDFAVLKDPEALAREKAEKLKTVAAVVSLADSAELAASRHQRALRDEVRVLRRRSSRDADKTEVSLALSEATLIKLLIGDGADELLEQGENLARDVMRRGYASDSLLAELARYSSVKIVDPLGEVIVPTEQLLTGARITELAARRAAHAGLDPVALAEVARSIAIPNVVLDRAATAAAVTQAEASVDPVAGMVAKGEKVIGAHERITPETQRVLRSYEYWRDKRGLDASSFRKLLPALGDILLVLVLVGAFVVYLWTHHRELLERPEDFWLLAGIEALVLLLAFVLIKGFELPSILVPVAAAAILATLFFGERLGMAATLLPVFLVALVADGGTPFFAVVGMGSMGAVLLTPRVRQRGHIYRLLLLVPLVHLVVLLALTLAEGTPMSLVWRNGLAAAGSPLLAIAVAFFFLPILESVFHRSTDLSLLALSDLKRPALRRLFLAAPGTFQHSVVVGTLADAAARVVDANALLARVIGYYHDLGKVSKPEYFGENLAAGRPDPHDKLAPSMSRMLLEAHLREGVEEAERLKLPREVVQGIREHHGVQVMAALVRKAEQLELPAEPSTFQYPGPIPTSRESALVLLANAVEEQARTLEDPSPSRVKGLVTTVVQENLQNGNLDESGLSLQELARVRDVFANFLSAALRTRAIRRSDDGDAREASADRAPLAEPRG